MNLTEELDRSFGNGPEHRPIEDRLVAGRRLVRRRRLAAGAAALAVAAVVTSGALVAEGSPATSGSDTGIATQPAEPEPKAELEPGETVRLDRDGTLVTRDGVEVIETVDAPLGADNPEPSLGVAYTFRGETYWGLLEPSGSTTEIAQQSFPSFEYWLDDQVALQRGEETLALVRFGDRESLLAREGVEIIQQTGDLDEMPSNFAGPNARTAIAEVTYRGERWYVLARQIGNQPPEYFPTAASVSRPTLEEFIPYAADSYAEGTGLR